MLVNLKYREFKKILARKNMSQNRFAIKVGVSSGYMSQLMSGIRNPSPSLRERILVALKMVDSQFDEIFELND